MVPARALRIAGYSGFCVLALLVSLTLTMPADAIAQRLGHELQRASRGACTLAYADAGGWRLSGVALSDVTLRCAAPGSEPMTLRLDGLRARLRLLPLFAAQLSLGAEVALGEGRLAGVFGRRGSGIEAALELHDIALGRGGLAPLVVRLVGLPLGGTLGGQLAYSGGALAQSSGELTLQLADGAIGPGAVSGMGLPRIGLGSLDVGAELRGGRAKLTEFKQRGGAVSLRLKGSAQLAEPLVASRLEACGQLRAEAQLLQQNPTLGSLVRLAEVQLKKDAEGYLHVPVAGTVGAPRLTGGLCR